MLDFVKKLFGFNTPKPIEPQAPYKIEPILDPISKPEPEQTQTHVRVEETAPTAVEEKPAKKTRAKKEVVEPQVEIPKKTKKKKTGN